MTSSANNSTNIPLNGGATWVGLWESPADTIQGVQLLINTNVSGTAYIQFSQDRSRVEYEHAYGVIGGIALYKIERRKAKYIRVKYVNDASQQTLMLLHTTYLTDYEKEDMPITVDAEDSNILIFGELPSGGLQAVKLDASGNLKVSGISGGGVSSNVTVENFPAEQAVTGTFWQATQPVSIDTLPTIEINNFPAEQAVTGTFWQATQPVSIDTLPTIEINNFPAEQAVTGTFWQATQPVSIDAEVSVRDASAIELLGQIADGIVVQVGDVDISGVSLVDGKLPTLDASAITVLENIYTATASTDINTTPIAYSPVHLDLESQGATVWADSTLSWTTPLNGENGWLYENKTAGGAQVYFYSNTALVAGGLEPDITLGSVSNMSFVGNYRLLLDSNPNKKFYISLTTKPTGTGDYYPGVFHSRKVWELPASTVVSKGADYLFYAMDDITSFRRDLEHKQMVLAISNGDCGAAEIVQFMSINVDSGTTVNQFSGIVKEAYFSTAGGANRQVVFDNSLEKRATKKLTELSVSDGNLLVSVSNASIAITSSSALSVTETNPITDYSTETTSALIKAQTDKLSFYADAYGAFDLRTSVVNEVGVSVNNTPTVSFSSGSEVGLTAGTQVALVSGTQVQLVGSEVGLTAGTQVGLSAGASVDVNNFPSKQSVFVENTAEGFDLNVNVTNGSLAITAASALSVTETSPITSVFAKLKDADDVALTSSATESNGNVLNTRLFGYDVANDLVRPIRQGENGGIFVENITSVDFEVVVKNTPKVEISGNVVISDLSVNVLNSSLNTHMYASANGSTWHHLASDANGQLNVHAKTQDGAGNDITSTNGGTVRSLDVQIQNTAVPVSNTNANALYGRTRDVSNVQVANNVTVTGPVRVGSSDADTQGYTYISAIMSFTSVTTGGQIYLEVSHDANLWARPSSASTFVMSSGASVTASILLSSPVPFRYARLWADTGFVGLGCSAWICMK